MSNEIKVITLDNLSIFKDNLDEKLAGKQDVLPAVTNDRYLHTNASTGALEWASLADHPVTDVEVNGSSVVTDTVASITVPTDTSDLTNNAGFITGVAWGDVTNKPNFATVATSGSYDDLSNKPTIPTVNYPVTDVEVNGSSVVSNTVASITVPTDTSDLTNGAGFITGVAWSDVTDKPTLATVATSGSYADLSNKPTIPTDTNQKVTVKVNGTVVDFGADTSVEIKAGSNVSVTGDTTENTITIAATDTTYTAGKGINITSGQIKATGVEYTAGGNVQATALKFEKITQSAYNNLQNPDSNTFYIVVAD